MVRVVLDTNILVSALLSPAGAPAQAFLLCLTEADIQLCLSAAIYAEYEEVLRRPKFRRTEAEVQALLRVLRSHGFWVRPVIRVQACSDPNDDIFLECVQAAEVHYLVTGNVKHFPTAFQGTKVVTSRLFVEMLT